MGRELIKSKNVQPSILAADYSRLGEQLAQVMDAGARVIHVDVMDGHFVPNITIGPPVARSLKRVATVPLDVHLMITEPDRYIDAFASAGAGSRRSLTGWSASLMALSCLPRPTCCGGRIWPRNGGSAM